jgi:hypothetical protein
MSDQENEFFEQLQRAWQGQVLVEGPTGELVERTRRVIGAVERGRRLRRVGAVIAAGIILVVGCLVVWLAPTNGPVVWADVIQEVQAAKTVTWKTANGTQTFFIKGDRRRWEGDERKVGGLGPYVVIQDLKSGDTIWIVRDPASPGVQQEHGVPDLTDPYHLLKTIGEHATRSLGEKVFDGRKVIGFSGEVPTTQPDGQQIFVPENVWVDPVTRLPVRIEKMDAVTNRVGVVLTDIRFDVPLDDSLFDMTPPRGLAVHDLPWAAINQIKAPDAAVVASLILRPGEGLGELKLGDSPDRITELFGQPDEPLSENNYVAHRYIYASLGLEIIAGKRREAKDWHVAAIWCRSTNMSTFPCRDFPGRTEAGIHIGSARQDVVEAYGQPEWSDAQNMYYVHRGLSVYLLEDGVTVTGLTVEAADGPELVKTVQSLSAPH